MTDNLTRVVEKVKNRLERLFEDGCSTPNTGIMFPPPNSELLTQVRSLTMRGGKRLRAAMIVCGADLFEDLGENSAVIDAAAALEILHTYFLIHDDIMDEDDTRRGGPSVHTALASQYDDIKQGRNLAVLAGDLAASLQEGLIADLDTLEVRRRRVSKIFAEMHLEVIHGQTLDILGCTDAEEIAVRKTASYTTIGPLTVGAALAGASSEEQLRLADLARPLGVAFQFKDDMLSVFGDPSRTGKPVGTDIKEGKSTFLIQEVMRLGNDHQKSAVQLVLGNDQASNDMLETAVNVIRESGAKSSCENKIRSLVDQALLVLEDEKYRPEGKMFLRELARMMTERDK